MTLLYDVFTCCVQEEVPRLIVLTKSDLLSVEELAASMTAVAADLEQIPYTNTQNAAKEAKLEVFTGSELWRSLGFPDIVPVSAATGAGVQTLWQVLLSVARQSSKELPDAPSEIFAGGRPFVSARAGLPLRQESTAVREHKLAGKLREQHSIKVISSRKPSSKKTSTTLTMKVDVELEEQVQREILDSK